MAKGPVVIGRTRIFQILIGGFGP